MKKINDQFEVLRKFKKPKTSQRELANELGFSLGKLNYCLKALQKGLIKISNFKNNPDKKSYLHILTPVMHKRKQF